MSSCLIAVEERSIRTTDRVALNLFRQLRRMTAADRRFVLSALDSRIGGALDERVVAVRSAIDLFRLETGEPLSKRKYERWRVSRADSRGLPSATFIANTWPGASWSRAMDQLGFQPGPDHAARRMALAGPYRSDEELIEHLRECAAELVRTPRVSEYDAWQREKVRAGSGRYLGVQTYRNRFGDWPRALVAAGLPYDGRREPRTTLREWEAGQPFDLLRQAAAEFGGDRLRRAQYVAWRERRLAENRARGVHTPIATADTFCYRYGGWTRALAAAGLLTQEAVANLRLGAGRAFSDTELDAAISRFAAESVAGTGPGDYTTWRARVMRRELATHLPSQTLLHRRLGGWTRIAQLVSERRVAAQRDDS